MASVGRLRLSSHSRIQLSMSLVTRASRYQMIEVYNSSRVENMHPRPKSTHNHFHAARDLQPLYETLQAHCLFTDICGTRARFAGNVRNS